MQLAVQSGESAIARSWIFESGVRPCRHLTVLARSMRQLRPVVATGQPSFLCWRTHGNSLCENSWPHRASWLAGVLLVNMPRKYVVEKRPRASGVNGKRVTYLA